MNNVVLHDLQTFGLLVGSLLVAVEIVNGHKHTSNFVFFITYFAQVREPMPYLPNLSTLSL